MSIIDKKVSKAFSNTKEVKQGKWLNSLAIEISQWVLKGIVKGAEPCICDIHLVSRILWHKWIIPALKE